jgi:DnaJ-class molecular chaperone
MSNAAVDPYVVLGVARDVSDIELRRVYRGLVKRYHPDHNAGSAESAARFAQIQNAYAQIAHERRPPQPEPPGQSAARTSGVPVTNAPRPAPPGGGDSGIENRIASLEREMQALREAEQQRAQEVRANQTERRRPTPEELGYYTTDDSLTKIIDDAADQLGDRLHGSDAKRQFARRLSDLFGRDG